MYNERKMLDIIIQQLHHFLSVISFILRRSLWIKRPKRANHTRNIEDIAYHKKIRSYNTALVYKIAHSYLNKHTHGS